MVSRLWLVTLATLGTLSLVTPSFAKKDSKKEAESSAEKESADTAQTGEEKAEGTDEAAGEEKKEEESSEKSDDEEAADKKEEAQDEKKGSADSDTSPVEEKGKTYMFVGARYRLILVPKFMMNLFGDGGTTVGVHSFGAEFAVRKDGFEYDFAAWYAAYSMDPTIFKSKSDGEEAWEIVESNIKVLYLTADFLWSHSFSPELALNYGGGAGFGFVFGPLYRTQAYKDAAGKYQPCIDKFTPATPVPTTNILYCNNDNDHYKGFEEPSWANGGSKPIIFPWLALQTGLRYKPHRNFAARFDMGFGLSGFFFGIGADYGL